MIQRSVRARFRRVYWQPPASLPDGPKIFVPNHHGWYDGYLMFLALQRLQLSFLDWVQEFDAFPLFGKVGGMPFPPNDAAARARTIRTSIRALTEGRRHLLLFAEGILHRPPGLLEFGKALQTVASKVPGAHVIPVGIRYDASLHERPEAWLRFGAPIAAHDGICAECRQSVQGLLDQIATDLQTPEPEASYTVLFQGTLDVNERLDMRKFRKS